MLSRGQSDVLSIIGSSDYLETPDGDIRINCPFCGNDNHKLYVSKGLLYHCWVCDTSGGSLASFVMKYHECSYKEAMTFLKTSEMTNESSINPVRITEENDLLSTLFDANNDIIVEEKTKMPKLPTNAKSLLKNLANPEVIPFINYLGSRKLTKEQVIYLDPMYVISGEIEREDKPNIPISNSIIFITRGHGGKPIYWSTRSIEKDPFVKSLNAPAKDDEYSKADIFFNINLINESTKVVICEGIFNAMMVTQGDYVGIATFGKAITDSQLQKLISYHPKEYILFLDNDAKDLEMKLIKRLNNYGIPYDNIKFVNNPYEDKDANDLGTKVSMELVKQAKPSSPMVLMSYAIKERM
jgi:DNA primase